MRRLAKKSEKDGTVASFVDAISNPGAHQIKRAALNLSGRGS